MAGSRDHRSTRGRGLPSWLPRGGSLPEPAWQVRHRWVVGLLALHVVGLPLYAWHRGESLVHTFHSLTPVVALVALACTPSLGRTARASCAAFGLIYCSGYLVHLSDGLVEAHFHFFVVIPIIALYEAWLPFALGVLYVLIHHGWMGTVDPRTVYNHPAAWERPWLFAAVHATFFACACLACIVNWWLHERAREAAQAQSRLLTTIVHSLHDGLVVTDADGEVLLSNPATDRLLAGVAWRPSATSDGAGLRHPDGRPVGHREMPHVRALAGDQVHDLDLLAGGLGEEERVLSFSATALATGVTEDDAAVVVLASDVTERHRSQQAMSDALATEQRAVQRLKELEQAKSDLVSTVSHELRTPLTSIIGYLQMLQDGVLGTVDQPQREVVDRVQRNSQRLLVLVSDLLTHSQIEAGGMSVTTAPVDVRAVVEGAHDSVAALLAGRALELRVDVPDRPVVLDGDAEELGRMVVNLLTNAIKFTPDGGLVRVGLTDDGGSVTLVVADDGLGIPDDEQGRLFTRFFRSSMVIERAIQGTGLGLTIVRAVVQAHGGTVSVDSAVGSGSTFTVVLPRGRTAPRLPAWADGAARGGTPRLSSTVP